MKVYGRLIAALLVAGASPAVAWRSTSGPWRPLSPRRRQPLRQPRQQNLKQNPETATPQTASLSEPRRMP